jgi:hypothetical protein
MSIAWVADYEAWMAKTAGAKYRNERVRTLRRPFACTEKMPTAWRFLGERRGEHHQKPLAQTLKQHTIVRRS